VRKACSLFEQGKYLDGLIPYIRPLDEDKPPRGSHNSKQRFACHWNLVLHWEEIDLEAVSRNYEAEKKLFLNYVPGTDMDRYHDLKVDIQGAEIDHPLDTVPLPFIFFLDLTCLPFPSFMLSLA